MDATPRLTLGLGQIGEQPLFRVWPKSTSFPAQEDKAVRAGVGGRGLGRGQRRRAALTEAGRGGHRDAVVVRVRAHGRLQAVEVTVLIRAREAHQGAGCGGREARHVTPVSGPGGPPSGAPPAPCPLPVRNPQSLVGVNRAIITLQTQAAGPNAQRGVSGADPRPPGEQ